MLLFPPLNFGAVEADVYRSAIPTEINFPFLETLQLKTIIIFGDSADETLLNFLEQHSIRYVHVENALRSVDINGQIPMSDDIVVAALRVISNVANLPVLISCRSGKFITGVVVGCLRKMQQWSLVSIFEEYRRLAGYSGTGLQQQHEQFIELFDTDLVAISDAAPPFLSI